MTTIYVTGSNACGQIGIHEGQVTSWIAFPLSTNDSDKNTFGSRLHFDHHIVKVRCGGNFSLFLMRNGQVFGIGDNHFGNYGRHKGDTLHNDSLFEIEALIQENIVDLDAGFNFSYFLTGDGRLFRCGSNSDGELSTNDDDDESMNVLCAPVDQSLFGGYPVVQVSCGGNFVCALTSDNKLYACGQDGTEQYSLFTHVDFTSASLAGQIIKKVSCGAYHCVVLMENGVLYGAGSPLFPEGRLRDIQEEPFPMKIRDAICGYNYFMCIAEDGRLYGSVGSRKRGMILDGQLGSTDECDEPYGGFVVTQFEHPIAEVITGSSSTTTIVTLSNGDIYITGCNERGGLGLGDTNNRTTFEKLPRTNQTMAVTAATGAFHSVLCYYDAINHSNWQSNLWAIKKKNKLTDLDVLF